MTSVRLPDALLVPDHDLIERIGRGGYGEVWLARNRTTNTLRAVKIVFRDEFEDERPYRREFEGLLKFEPVSRSHPSQLAILHVGRNDDAGCFYYVMELADDSNAECGVRSAESTLTRPTDTLSHRMGEGRGEGKRIPHSEIRTPHSYAPRTLRADLRRGRLPAAEVIELGRALATALAHLHSHGLVHRDIKPANIVYVGGVPKLADIGLVTHASDTCSIVGTEGYIPPEGPGSPQADLYSLGKVLYEAATGQDRRDYPALPDDLRSWLDSNLLTELNVVILRACAHDARQRYGSAATMLVDLESLQLGRSVKRLRARELARKRLKKAAFATSLLGLLIMSLILARSGRTKALDPLTTGKNVGGYPPTTMRGTRKLEAWNHYKLGWSLRNGPHDQAEHEFQEAIRLDPKFALAYWGLFRARFGDTWNLTHAKSPDEFRALAAKMVELDSGLAETHLVLGFIGFWEWNWWVADREYREALQLNPDCQPARTYYGFYLSHMGRSNEAIEVLEAARRVDPTSAQILKCMGHSYFVDRDFTNALTYYRESCRIDPSFAIGHSFASRTLIALNDYRAAINELEICETKRGIDPLEAKQKCEELRDAFSRLGMDGYWQKRLEQAKATLNTDDEPYAFATIYARLENKTQAFKYLDRAYERHDELFT